MTLLFVYGTLKRGLSNHHFLEGQAFVGEAETAPGFALYGLDAYPGMVAGADNAPGVTGEVWSVDDECLAQLDELEGTAEGLYRREAVPLKAPFADQRVEAYLYLKPVEGLTRLGNSWSW
jgi:gamma-glutamylaminecyclotransferase